MKILAYLAPSPLLKPKANIIQSSSQFYYLNSYFDQSFYLSISLLGRSQTSALLSDCSPLKHLPLGVFPLKRIPLFRGIFILHSFYQIIFCLCLLLSVKVSNLFSTKRTKVYIYSRSLISSFFLSYVPFDDHIFEVHGKENYTLLQNMQNLMISRNRLKRVYISNALRKIYNDFRSQRAIVLHDSSPFYTNTTLPSYIAKKIEKIKLEYKHMFIYSGSSGEGRGIELICELAKLLPEISFVMLSDKNIESSPKNVVWLGYLSHRLALKVIKYADFGLMPYQDNLQMGRFQINSLMWMSPLKLFDYMNSNVTIVSSFFPVLEEVINDGQTCLFVKDYSNAFAWYDLLSQVLNSNSSDYKKIALKAKNLFDEQYSYSQRSKSIMQLFYSYNT